MAALAALRNYAKLSIPSPQLPPSILFGHSEDTMTIFDRYPKAMFHFLVLPRLKDSMNPSHYKSLGTLLRSDKQEALECITKLQTAANELKDSIEEEMMSKYGCKWQINFGFHAVPSMEHVHLHVISADLCSESLKNKKHYNSFHPGLGFFLHLHEVLEWFEAEDSFYQSMAKLPTKQYEPILKEDLSCCKCKAAMKNIPTLKEHLKAEWKQDKERALKKAARQATKRKREGEDEEALGASHINKKVQIEGKAQSPKEATDE